MKKLYTAAVIAVLSCGPAGAEIPVSDAKAIALQTTSWMKQAAQLTTQIAQMREYLRISYLANAVLGEGMGTELSGLIDATQELASTMQSTYSEIASLPTMLESELSVFSPPPAGSGINGWMVKKRQIDSMLNRSSANAMALQTKMVRANAEYARQSAEQRKQMLQATGQMKATQILGMQLANISGQASGMQSTLTNIDEMMALRAQKEKTHIEEKKESHRLEIATMKSVSTAGARIMRVSPLTGR